jgi:hypothetical protein
MSAIKIGSKVIVKVGQGRNTASRYSSGRLLEGSVHTVRELCYDGSLGLEGSDHEGFSYHGYRFELVADDTNGVDENGKRIKFATADLKPFQRVEFRDGGGGMVGYEESGYLRIVDAMGGATLKARLNGVTEGIHGANSGYDIVKVYNPPAAYHALDFTARGSLVWEAQDFTELKRKQEAADKAIADAEKALAKAKAERAAL